MTVEVALSELPKGARPDLSVDGTVELEHLENVVYVGRPGLRREHSRAASSSSTPTACTPEPAR